MIDFWALSVKTSHVIVMVIFIIIRLKPKFNAGLGLCSITAGMLGAKSVVATDLRRAPCPRHRSTYVFAFASCVA